MKQILILPILCIVIMLWFLFATYIYDEFRIGLKVFFIMSPLPFIMLFIGYLIFKD